MKGSTTLGDSYDTDTISFNGRILNPIPFMFDEIRTFTTKLEIADQTSNIELVLPSTNGTILTTGNVMDEISGKTINCLGEDETGYKVGCLKVNYGQLVASGIRVDGRGAVDETIFRVDGKSIIDEVNVRDRFTFDGDKLIVDSQEVKISTNVKTSTGDIAIGHANNPENILLHGDTGVISLTGDIDFTDDIEIKDGTTTIFKGSSGIQKDREVCFIILK